MKTVTQPLDYVAQKEHTTRDPVPCTYTGEVGDRTMAILYDNTPIEQIDSDRVVYVPQNEYQELMGIGAGDMETIQRTIEQIITNNT